MATRKEIEGQIDRLIHDAEHKEAGADFARMMARMQPNVPDHAQYAERAAKEAVDLRTQAASLASEHGITVTEGEYGLEFS